MPISRDDFNKGALRPPQSALILNFLQNHKDKAFTDSDIIHGLDPEKTDSNLADQIYFMVSVTPLLHDQSVEFRMISDIAYFAVKQ